ncbi:MULTISPECIES: hypothetical protein [Acinetobacter calcoaceticus/baumannii complex]|nr:MULTISPECIES: hypothetical protein [Acinetobacter calcoaceticus/baumannii complex]HDG9824524.1 hypothetical protein [Acinetobacter nosocomialis]ATD21703.1 hypothetical protein BS098_18060 [Acinetobacter baumannii]AXG85466.1 hypothetical protein Aba810CP_12135 [Acinetobacter baumannii]EHU1746055.1 hypothetical protein [Acinetobacter baumannii]EHU1950015.1 hypothetical protein [Acinetobacter baumannii]
MTDLNKLRSEFESNEYIKSIIQNFEWSEEFNNYQIKDCVINGNIFDLLEAKNDEQFLNGAWFGWQEKAKAQAVPDTHIHSVTLTCAELKEAFDFGAPDGEKDQFQMETEMSIKWLDDGYDGAGYYCWYADLPEEGCIKLGESESGAEG